MSVINIAFLLAIVATTMDSAYSMHNAYRHSYLPSLGPLQRENQCVLG